VKRLDVTVLGCTGLVGRRFVRRLAVHPWFHIAGLAASAHSSGQRYGKLIADDSHGLPRRILSMRVIDTKDTRSLAEKCRLAFSALPRDVAFDIESELRRGGVMVFSNAAGHRMDEDVPILIPEVNPDHLEMARRQIHAYGGAIVTNPNCVTAGLAPALAPLLSLGLKDVNLVTCQALSGAGMSGPRALAMQGNILPFIEGEEEKISREIRRILGDLEKERLRPLDLKVTATANRTAVIHGHMLFVTADMESAVQEERVIEAFDSFNDGARKTKLPSSPGTFLEVIREPDRPQPRLDVDAGGPGRGTGMTITIGRLRFRGTRILFTALIHNLERGAAGGSILNAELSVCRGVIPEAPAGGAP